MPSSSSRSKKARTSSSSQAPPHQQPQHPQLFQQFQGPSPQQWQQPQLQPQLQWQQPQQQQQQQWQQPQLQQQWQQPQQQQFLTQPGHQMVQQVTQPSVAAAEAPPAAAAPTEASDSEESESEDKTSTYAKGLDATITRSAVAVAGLPKIRLSELVELVHEPFDSTVTAEFSPVDMATMIWLLCRIKPNVKICDLRVGTYRELGALLVKAKKRLMNSMGSSKFDDKLILPLGCTPTSDMVKQLAEENGFTEEWLITKKAPKAKAAPGQQLSLLPFVRPLPPTQPVDVPIAPATDALVAVEAPQAHQPVARVVVPPAAPAKAASRAGPPVLSSAPAAPVAALAPSAPSPAAQGSGSQEFSPDMMRQAMAFWLQQNPQHAVPTAPAEVVSPPAQDLVEPALVAPVVSEASQSSSPGQGDVEVRICAICQSALGSTSEYGESEALACAHVYHRTCLDQYCSATGKTRLNCCPLKCSASAYLTVEGDGGETLATAGDAAAMGSLGSVASVDEDALQMAAEAHAQALEMIS